MFGLSIWELLIILAIVLLIFGPSRLKNIGSDLGGAIKGFRTAIKDDGAEGSDKTEALDTETADQKTNV
ncbi:MAG: twin-arginine translocase TatA/TatE family subunit [Pseudomonadota bacterium]